MEQGKKRPLKLLLVEADDAHANEVKSFFDNFEFEVTVSQDMLEAESYVMREQPDIVVLEIPSGSSYSLRFCQRIRSRYHGLILIQCTLNQEHEQMTKLGFDADGYIFKPQQPRVLLSRVRALLRRAGLYTPSSTLSLEPLSRSRSLGNAEGLLIELERRCVSFKRQPINLTTAEFELLSLLANNPGELVTRDSIIQRIRGYEYDGLDRSVDRRVSRLRKKLCDNPAKPQFIKTIRGKGYQLCL